MVQYIIRNESDAPLSAKFAVESSFAQINFNSGGFNAFLWNVKGNVADIDLKKEYNPHKYRDDEYLESLLISNWQQGHLKPYTGYEKFAIGSNSK